jgi:regulator of Ty1 transposition protein 103
VKAEASCNSQRASLPDEGNGSRVVLITDSAGLSEVRWSGTPPAGPTYDSIELTRLSPEHTYEVFRRGDCPAWYKSTYYQEVFRITCGVPLSVVVLVPACCGPRSCRWSGTR